jgi:L-aminoadipate-semialdehyde dehydrogenase
LASAAWRHTWRINVSDLPRLLTELSVQHPTYGLAIGNRSLECRGQSVDASSPIDGGSTVSIRSVETSDVNAAVEAAVESFAEWRLVPPPVRGELVRRFGDVLRANKRPLAELVTLEAGKIQAESLGEVQEMIDICDFATGLSRQLYGLTIATERPSHRMMEQWHPLGPIGIISAFNFPVAVWAWNTALALVCGDTVLWKPSEKTPLTALACHSLLMQAAEGLDVPAGISSVVIGGRDVGAAIASDRRLPLVSATGSVAMGRSVAAAVAERLGRSLLELGGNNASIVTASADLDMAVRGIVFGAAGTCGQRCTSLRRLIVHSSIAGELLPRLRKAYASLAIGDPRHDSTLIGPLVGRKAFDDMQTALATARQQGGTVTGGDRVTDNVPQDGFYVRPAIVEMPAHTDIMFEETFAPILYVVRYEALPEAIAMQNGVTQGLSSSVFTTDLREAELFLSAAGSDCGIANVNMGPSGAEIGGAFGGEKDTGGGRESGSDSWKAYMRRATNSINFGSDLPLAQGIQFG